jgi:hypothetical protein
MTYTNFPFPYDIGNLLGGVVRILFAPLTQAIPADISSVIDMVSPYAPKSGWVEVGATKESFSHESGFDESGLEIQQTPDEVLEEMTAVSHTINVSFAELNPQNLQLIQGAPNIATIAAAAGKSAQKKVAFGGFQSRKNYRWAWISRRSIDSGIVVEPGGKERGRFFMGTAYRGKLAADSHTFEQNKGDLTAVGVGWKVSPEPGQVEGEEHGAYVDEQAGTIA